ncbi:MAG: hypothetical protein ABIT01_15105 [Thermoanaerobaculia bacterium]
MKRVALLLLVSATLAVSQEPFTPQGIHGDKTTKVLEGLKAKKVLLKLEQGSAAGLLLGPEVKTVFTMDGSLLQRFRKDLLETEIETTLPDGKKERSHLLSILSKKQDQVSIVTGSISSPDAYASVALVSVGSNAGLPGLDTNAKTWGAMLAAARTKYPERWRSALLRTGAIVLGAGSQLGTGLIIGSDRVLTNSHVVRGFVGALGNLSWVPLCKPSGDAVVCGYFPELAVKLQDIVSRVSCDSGATPSSPVGRDCALVRLAGAPPSIASARDWIQATIEINKAPMIILSAPSSTIPRCTSDAACKDDDKCATDSQKRRLDMVRKSNDGRLFLTFAPALSVCPSGKDMFELCPLPKPGCACPVPDLSGGVCYLGATMPGSSGGVALDIDTLGLLGLHAGGDRRGYSFNYGLPIKLAALAGP